MKTRLGLATLASAAVALGLLAPSAVTAAPTPEKPTDQAMVRIDGGTAYAIDKGNNRYRVVLPKGASISWMGEVGKELSIGTFTPKALVGGWSRLGHRDGPDSLTTLTWVEPGSADATYRLAHIGKPRINAKGQVTFAADVPRGLPAKMPKFSVNIARPEPVFVRSSPAASDTYSVPFPINMASDTVGMQVVATSDNSAGVSWFTVDSSGTQTPCANIPSTVLNLSNEGHDYGTVTCGDVTWNKINDGIQTYVTIKMGNSVTKPPTPTEVLSQATFTKAGQSTLFKWNFTAGSWYKGGSLTPP